MPQNPPANPPQMMPPTAPSFDRAPDESVSMKPGQPAGLEIPVPIESVSMPGEDDKMQSPSESDPVQFQVEGKISRIQGDIAFVAIESINGKPVSEQAAATKSTPEEMGEGEDAEFAQLRSEAANQKSY